MRLPLVFEVGSRDGTSDRDERITNALVGQSDAGVNVAELRPGLALATASSGVGNGLVNYSGALISVFGTTVARDAAVTTVGTVSGSRFDFCQSPL